MGSKLRAHLSTLFLLLGVGHKIAAHGHDSHNGMEGVTRGSATISPLANTTAAPTAITGTEASSYFTYPHHLNLMLAHILLMSLAWFFLLPIGISFLEQLENPC